MTPSPEGVLRSALVPPEHYALYRDNVYFKVSIDMLSRYLVPFVEVMAASAQEQERNAEVFKELLLASNPLSPPHTLNCPDPCRHDNECPHGYSNLAGETCPLCGN